MQRSSSGSRNGVNAMVHTLKSMNDLSLKKRSKEQFKNSFSDEFYKDYPDATTAEIDKQYANNIDWGKGQQLGRTPTELMKTENLPNVIKSFEERRANIAKSKLLLPTASPVAPAIPVVAPVAPVAPAPAKAPAQAAPQAAPQATPVTAAPAKAPPPPPAPKKAPPPPPAPVAPPPAVAKAPPKTSPKNTDDTRDYKPVNFQGLTKDENSNAKVHVKMAHVQITKSDIEKELERQNNRRFGFQHNKISYNTHWGKQGGKISAELI